MRRRAFAGTLPVMAVGDLEKRVAAEEAARLARRGSGINRSNISGSRIPNARDAEQQQRVRVAQARAAALIESGVNPADYGYDEQMRKTSAYTGYRLTKPASSTPTPPPANKTTPPPTTKPSGAGGTSNTIPPLLRPNAGQPRSLIGGEDAGAVLKRMRQEAKDKGLQPFAPSKSERGYDAAVERTRVANARDAATAAAAAAKTAGAAASLKNDAAMAEAAPTTLTPKPATPAATTTPTPAATQGTPSASPAPSPGASPQEGIADAVMRGGLLTSAAALAPAAVVARAGRLEGKAAAAFNDAIKMTDTANLAARRVASLEQRLAMGNKVIPRMSTRMLNAASEASRLKTAAAADKLAAGTLGVAKSYPSARIAERASTQASRLSDAVVAAGKSGVRTAEKLKTARTVADELFSTAAKTAARSDKLVTAANKAGRAATVLGKVGKVAGKVAVPLDVALSLVEGGRLVGDEQFRQERVREFEDYANKGAARSAAESALNPVSGIFSAVRQANEASKSKAQAALSEQAYNQAADEAARRKQIMDEQGITRATLDAMPVAERVALMKSIRDRARSGK